MKFIILFLVLIGSVFAADNVEIIVNPKEPVMGESFNVIFKISTKDGTDPLISFDPRGLEVLGRQDSGISTRTTYINGKLTVERNISTTYEMLANKAGTKFLQKIEVEINGRKLKHKNLSIRVLSKARRAKNIMAIAVVDKTEAFVGEAILVRYYLYHKTSVSSTDVKRFPKLNKFLKRFHQERLRPERVQVGNDIYTRQIIYTAQLFGEKPGKYKVDPISLSVNYSQSRGGGSFGGFGFRRMLKKTVSSKPVIIEVKQLPLAGVPGDFTGLVGKHSFELTLNKNKFLVNEPIEMKLRVKGTGALELFEAPTILSSDKLEEFEATNDFQVSPDFTSQKEFNITYLGREEFVSEAKKIDFSYFDPESLTYKRTSLDLGEIKVIGSVGQIASSPGKKSERKEMNEINSKKNETFDLTPAYTLQNNFIYHKRTIIYCILVVFLVMFILKLKNQYILYTNRDLTIIQEVRKNGLSYGKLHELLSLISNKGTMRENIESSSLSAKSKKSLNNLVEKAESLYSKNDDKTKLRIQSSVLSEVTSILKKKSDEA